MKRFTTLFAAIVALVGLSVAPVSAQNFSSIQTLNGSTAVPAYTFKNAATSGFYLSGTANIGVAISGTNVATFTSTGLTFNQTSGPLQFNSTAGTVTAVTPTTTTTSSLQALSGDLHLSGTTGHAGGYDGGVMGNVFDDAAISAGGAGATVAGLIGKATIINSSSYNSGYPVAGVVGENGSNLSTSVAVMAAASDTDKGTTVTQNAMFGVNYQFATAASSVNYGLDLSGLGAFDVYPAINQPGSKGFAKCDINLSRNICITVGPGAPVNAVTGVNVMATGSLFIGAVGGTTKLWQNTGTISSPVWTVVGTQS